MTRCGHGSGHGAFLEGAQEDGNCGDHPSAPGGVDIGDPPNDLTPCPRNCCWPRRDQPLPCGPGGGGGHGGGG